MEKFIFRILFLSDIFGELYGRPSPDNYSKSGDGLINIINSPESPTSSDTPEKYLLKGGIPRIQRKIREIIKYAKYDEIMLVSGGSMINGTAETLFSQGQIMVKALNRLGSKNNRIEYHVPGVMDYVYGKNIFEYTYCGGRYPNNPDWIKLAKDKELEHLNGKTLSHNLYTQDKLGNRHHVLLPYDIKDYGDIKIGMIGLTVDQKSCILHNNNYQIDGHIKRSIIGQNIIDDELIRTVRKLRKICDCIILISNYGLSGNIRLAELEQLHGCTIDVILSCGTQEVHSTITTNNKTLIYEIGSYGENIGSVKLEIDINTKKLLNKSINTYHVGPYVKENNKMRKYIDGLINDYYPADSNLEIPNTVNNKVISSQSYNNSFINRINNEGMANSTIDLMGSNIGSNIKYDIYVPRNDIFPTRGMTKQYNGKIIDNVYFGLHRSNFLSHILFPGIVEGISSNLISECIRRYTECQIGMIRGFNNNMCIESSGNLSYDHDNVSHGYGTGCLTKYDIFNSLSTSMYVGRGYMTGQKILNIIRNSIYTSIHKNIYNLHSEYIMAFSGIKIILDHDSDIDKVLGPSQIKFKSIKVLSNYDKSPFNIVDNYEEIDVNKYYSVGSHMNTHNPDRINNIKIDKLFKSNGENNRENNIFVFDKMKEDGSLIHPAVAVSQFMESLEIDELKCLLYNISRLPNIFMNTIDKKMLHNF